tara:strand:- start:277 stop:447 length:171 start_codon:yes stop_codon:yes gene_type:complete
MVEKQESSLDFFPSRSMEGTDGQLLDHNLGTNIYREGQLGQKVGNQINNLLKMIKN